MVAIGASSSKPELLPSAGYTRTWTEIIRNIDLVLGIECDADRNGETSGRAVDRGQWRGISVAACRIDVNDSAAGRTSPHIRETLDVYYVDLAGRIEREAFGFNESSRGRGADKGGRGFIEGGGAAAQP